MPLAALAAADAPNGPPPVAEPSTCRWPCPPRQLFASPQRRPARHQARRQPAHRRRRGATLASPTAEAPPLQRARPVGGVEQLSLLQAAEAATLALSEAHPELAAWHLTRRPPPSRAPPPISEDWPAALTPDAIAAAALPLSCRADTFSSIPATTTAADAVTDGGGRAGGR